MSGLRDHAVLLCGMAVLCTLAHRLLPESGIGKQGRMILPCLFLCAMLTPVLQIGGLPDTWRWEQAAVGQTDGGEELMERMRQQTVQQVEQILLRMVDQALASYGMSAEKVTAEMDIAEDGSIDMGQITVYVDEATAVRSVAVAQIASARLGVPVTVAAGEGGAG